MEKQREVKQMKARKNAASFGGMYLCGPCRLTARRSHAGKRQVFFPFGCPPAPIRVILGHTEPLSAKQLCLLRRWLELINFGYYEERNQLPSLRRGAAVVYVPEEQEIAADVTTAYLTGRLRYCFICSDELVGAVEHNNMLVCSACHNNEGNADKDVPLCLLGLP